MAKVGAEKIWHQFEKPLQNLVQNSQTVAQEQAQTAAGGCYFLWAFGRLLLFLGGFWMVAWMVALISWRLLGTMAMCVRRALKMTPRKMASDLQIPWHNLAHFCCAKFCRSKFRLFLIFPSPGIFGQ